MHPIGHSTASTRLKKGLKASFQMKKWAIVAPVEKKDFEKKRRRKKTLSKMSSRKRERKKKLRRKRIWKDQEPVMFSFD